MSVHVCRYVCASFLGKSALVKETTPLKSKKYANIFIIIYYDPMEYHVL